MRFEARPVNLRKALTSLSILIFLSSGNTYSVLADSSLNPITGIKKSFQAESNYLPKEFQTINTSLNQVTSVSELRDIEPSHWAYQALEELIERYGCLVGYPDRTYRGKQALSRWEFAVAVNACLNRIERLLEENVHLAEEKINKIKHLAKEFKPELALLGSRVNNLENRASILENHQFSTTTKLLVQNFWSVDNAFGRKVGGNQNESQTQFGYRIRFNLETSFTGRDLFRTRLQAGNLVPNSVVTNTDMTRFNYDNDSNNQIQTPHLFYLTPLGKNLTLRVGPVGISYTNLTTTITPPTISNDSLGIPSRFGEYDLIYRRSGGGGAINWRITSDIGLTLGYVAGNAANPQVGRGLFNGNYHALAQLVWNGKDGMIGFAYSRSYYPSGNVNLTSNTSSKLAQQPFGNEIATTGDFFTLQGYYRFTPNLQIHGWGGYISAKALQSGLGSIPDGIGGTSLQTVTNGNHASIWYGAVGLSFPDFGGEGNLPGILLGIPPAVANSSLESDASTAYHLEAYYRIRLNDYITITPGFWVILNPENDSRNATQWVGHIRTSFNF